MAIWETPWMSFASFVIVLRMLSLTVCGDKPETPPNPELSSALPCPDPEVIAPCKCTYDSALTMDMDCSNVTSEDELRRVFSHDFAFTNFRKLTITHNYITSLRAGYLGSASFTEIHIKNTSLSETEDCNHKCSCHTLIILNINDSLNTKFPNVSSTMLLSLNLEANQTDHIPEDIVTPMTLARHCPDPEVIAPCKCTSNLTDSLDMDCSDVRSKNELRGVFSNDFDFTDFRKFTKANNQNIHLLREGDLGSVSFTEIDIINTSLSEIEDGALIGSFHTLDTLNIHENRLKSVPDISAFTRLKNLRADHNQIKFQNESSTTLLTLHLSFNQIDDIHQDAIIGLTSLEKLYLSGNSLTKIHPNTFTRNEDLNYLSLRGNKLTSIPDDAITLHGEDTFLDLSSNQITSLTYEAVSSVNGQLDVSYNNLTEVPEKVFRPLLEDSVGVYLYGNPFKCGCDIAWLVLNQTLLKSLRFLDGTKCSDGELFTDLQPEVVCPNKTLLCLNLDVNQTDEVTPIWARRCPDPEVITPCECYLYPTGDMDMDCSKVTSEDELRRIFNNDFAFTDFRRFTITHNQNIQLIREGDLGDVSFTEIDITSTSLSKIEDCALKGSFHTLETLIIYFNRLKFVPDISAFTRLKYIDAQNNNINKFPSGSSASLLTLFLQQNQIDDVPEDSVKEIKSLGTLSLHGNRLTEIHPHTFTQNEHLSLLNLGSNNLTSIPDDAITLHGQSTQLSLNKNPITSLTYEVVSSVNYWLDVSINNLTEVTEKVFRPLLEDFVSVILYDNPFKCGCDMAWLVLNQTLLNRLDWLSLNTCSDGELFTDLDPEEYKVMCPNATAVSLKLH